MTFPTWRILTGDCRSLLRTLDAGSVQTCVTSPPYFGLRDYGTAGQLGLEAAPDEYVAVLVDVFREVRRVLRDDGTVWLNLGDSYNNRAVNRPSSHQAGLGFEREHLGTAWRDHAANGRARMSIHDGDLKEKDLLGVPWLVAFALRADGWYLRSEIIWAKRNCMPESVTDRPTKAHEQIFLLSKRPSYFYDADAIREAWVDERNGASGAVASKYADPLTFRQDGGVTQAPTVTGRNKRSVWTVATQPYPGAHFATFPPKLIEPCILAGCPERACSVCGAPWERIVENHGPDKPNDHERHTPGIAGRSDNGRQQGLSGVAMGTRWHRETLGWEPSCGHDAPTIRGVVLDPFAGAGTTGLVALRHNRSFIGIELNPAYAALARDRIIDDSPLLNTHAEVMP